ncbi:MAG: hypothetical protein CM15mV90_340 [uncultured marine virus]|nr:MAG: hypothetical protein CM15mV90_340 [uncultured marine virus]
MLQAVANVAGAETKVGQALLIAKNILTMKEMIMDLKKITFKGNALLPKLVLMQPKTSWNQNWSRKTL